MLVFFKGIIDNFGKIIVFKIIYKHAETFGNVLGDDMTDHKIGFARARGAQYQHPAKWINDINPAFSSFVF
ncbi:hypothetical protein D9M71_769630 [compost metagenome]